MVDDLASPPEPDGDAPEALFLPGGFTPPRSMKARRHMSLGFSATVGAFVIVIGLTFLYVRLVLQITGVAPCADRSYCAMTTVLGTGFVEATYEWWVLFVVGGALIAYGIWVGWKERW